MNNELPEEWNNLVDDSKDGLGALLFEYDAAIIAADELMKEQQSEIEHYKNQLDRVGEDGEFKPSDSMTKCYEYLRENPDASPEQIWQAATQYADR